MRARLARITLHQGAQRTRQPLPRLRFCAAHETEVTATARTDWL
jgi:hypothetical protein